MKLNSLLFIFGLIAMSASISCSSNPASWTANVSELKCGLTSGKIQETLGRVVTERETPSSHRGTHATRRSSDGSYVRFWIGDAGLEKYQVVNEYFLKRVKVFPAVDVC